jgi:AcrR family transcriptional regulator
MRKTKTTDVSARRDALLQAAAGVFTEHGYANATIDEVAARAGVAKGTVYTYFKSKQHLFREVFTQFNPQHEAKLLAGLARAPNAVTKMELLLEGWYARHAQRLRNPLIIEFWQAAVRQEDGVLMDVFRRKYLFWHGMMVEILAEGIASGEYRDEPSPEVTATLLMAMFDGLGLQSMLNIGLSMDRSIFDQLLKGIFESLAPREDSHSNE